MFQQLTLVATSGAAATIASDALMNPFDGTSSSLHLASRGRSAAAGSW